MKRFASTSSLLALALILTPAHFVFDDNGLALEQTQAIAGPGNGKGGGSGNGNAGGNGNGHGHGKGNANGRSASANGSLLGAFGKNKSVKIASTNRQGKQTGQARAAFARELASLFGNLNAFRGYRSWGKTNETSNVGLIGVFAGAVQDRNLQSTGPNEIIAEQTAILTAAELTQDQIAQYAGMDEAAIQQAVTDGEITQEVADALSSLQSAQTQLTELETAVDTAFDNAAKKNYTPEEREVVKTELEHQLSLINQIYESPPAE